MTITVASHPETLRAGRSERQYTPVRVDTTTSMRMVPALNPIEYRNTSVIVDTAIMEPDRPYPYQLEGHWFFVVKRPNGDLDYFALPA